MRAPQGNRQGLITLDLVGLADLLNPVEIALLGRALVEGIGPGKALGMAMLSLAPLRPAEVS